MDYSKLGTAAAQAEDMTVNKSFEREIPRAGVALLRFVSYIELGRHEAAASTGYKPSLKAMLGFELNHPDHMIEIEGKKVPQTITVRLNKGQTSKSGFRKLFNVMNAACGGEHTHFLQMLGKGFLGEVYHNTVGEGDKKKVYANLDKDGAYSLKAPSQVDALTNTSTALPIAEVSGDITAFLWENEGVTDEDIQEMWDGIFIDGTREVEDPKTKEKVQKSKNWIQETIMNNIEWEGSRTQGITQEHISIEDHAETETSSEAHSDSDLPSMDD